MESSFIIITILIGAMLEIILGQVSPYYKTKRTRSNPKIFYNNTTAIIETTKTLMVDATIHYYFGYSAYFFIGSATSVIAAFYCMFEILVWPQGVSILLMDIIYIIAILIASICITTLLSLVAITSECLNASATKRRFETRYGMPVRDYRYSENTH